MVRLEGFEPPTLGSVDSLTNLKLLRLPLIVEEILVGLFAYVRGSWAA